jgi:hypothetical protein
MTSNNKEFKISNIFSGQEYHQSQRKHMKNSSCSHIMFNDNYVEPNPNIKEWRKTRYIVEEKFKNHATYFDDLKKPKNTLAFKRKIRDNIGNNPMKPFNNEEIKKYYDKERQKLENKEKIFNKVFGSDNLKRTLGGMNKKYNMDKERFNSDKINNNNFNITKNAMILNKDESKKIPYYGRKNFVSHNISNDK